MYQNGNRSVDEASNIRNFYKVQVACAELQKCMKTLYECGMSTEELDNMAGSSSPVDQAIANSPAMRMAANLAEIRDPFDVSAMLEYFQFDPESNAVDDFIYYPVISDPKLENLAFIHKSFTNMNVKLTEAEKTVMSNERLEFLGDSWLGAFVAHICYKKYPFADEGALSAMKTAIVNNSNLARLSEALGFRDRLKANIAKSKMKIKDRFSKHYADCVEAYIGALVVDRFGSDLQEVEDWIEHLAEEQFRELGPEMSKKPLNRNAKGELAELLQYNTLNLRLMYEKLNESSPFKVRAMLGPHILAYGEGHTIREAEQRAAMIVLDDHDMLQKYCPFELEDNVEQPQYIVDDDVTDMEEQIAGEHTAFKTTTTTETHVEAETVSAHTVEEVVPEELPVETPAPAPTETKTAKVPVDDNAAPRVQKPNAQNIATDSANKENVPPVKKEKEDVKPATTNVPAAERKSNGDDISEITEEVMSRLSSMLSELVTTTVSEITMKRQAYDSSNKPSEEVKRMKVDVTEEVDVQVNEPEVAPEEPTPSTIPAPSAVPAAVPEKSVPSTNTTQETAPVARTPAPSVTLSSRYAKLPFSAAPFVPTSASKPAPPPPQPYRPPTASSMLQPPLNPTGEAIDNQASQKLYAILGSLKDFPDYTIYQEDDGMFHAVCLLKSSGQVLGEGVSRNKKGAKHLAATNALQGAELQALMP